MTQVLINNSEQTAVEQQMVVNGLIGAAVKGSKRIISGGMAKAQKGAKSFKAGARLGSKGPTAPLVSLKDVRAMKKSPGLATIGTKVGSAGKAIRNNPKKAAAIGAAGGIGGASVYAMSRKRKSYKKN